MTATLFSGTRLPKRSTTLRLQVPVLVRQDDWDTGLHRLLGVGAGAVWSRSARLREPDAHGSERIASRRLAHRLTRPATVTVIPVASFGVQCACMSRHSLALPGRCAAYEHM